MRLASRPWLRAGLQRPGRGGDRQPPGGVQRCSSPPRTPRGRRCVWSMNRPSATTDHLGRRPARAGRAWCARPTLLTCAGRCCGRWRDRCAMTVGPSSHMAVAFARQHHLWGETATSTEARRKLAWRGAGLMQIMPAMARLIARQHKVTHAERRLISDPGLQLHIPGRAGDHHLISRGQLRTEPAGPIYGIVPHWPRPDL
jgi:hypothetical protein